MSKRSIRYTEEFKINISKLANTGKSVTELVDEFGVARSTLHKWIRDFNNTKSFKAKDNRTQEEKELLNLRKEVEQLRMENDILKQAALILGQK